jgi:xanthine dehydrogenase large subunit
MSVGKNIPHDSSQAHTTGRSIFIDDRPLHKNELFVTYLGSPVAKGKLLNIDASKALEIEGVIAVYTASDIFHNKWGAIAAEQPLIVSDQISYLDEPICIIAAESDELLSLAKKAIVVKIKEEKPLLDLKKAIDDKSFLYQASPFKRGDVNSALSQSKHTLKGEFECGGQEHFYLESHAAVAYPLDFGGIEVHSSSQHPSETQHVVAEAIGLKFHQVVCVVKRMGGAFGGKESQAAPIAAYAGLVAYKTNRPARMILSKDDDMKLTGKRHPFCNRYEIGFDDHGNIEALKVDIYCDAGAYPDLSSSILERAMFHVDGAYYIPTLEINGFACRTNHISNTAFRGFGGPQGNMTIESILEDMAAKLNLDSFKVRRTNVYGLTERNITPYGQEVDNNTLPKLFDELYKSSDYEKRLLEITKFNKAKNGTLRGISVTAVKFGIAFTARFLNQGNALVNLHMDGTVQVSTGATEMGQGVNTKIKQIVATEFSIPAENVQVMDTSTEKNHNTSPTAASSGSDINGAAAVLACQKITRRLKIVAYRFFNDEPFNDVDEYELELDDVNDLLHYEFKNSEIVDNQSKKSITLLKAISVAYLNRVSLSGYGHFKTKNIGFDKKKGLGKPFNYFTNGVACSEVEIDEYTGEMKVRRVDIAMDLGRPINLGIDNGQVSGGFVQGMGWVTNEKLFYSDKGDLLSHSPTTYKIPNIQDTPRIFNINLIENNDNEQNVHKSKAVGEPPLLLGASVWTAAKRAILARISGQSNFKSPATNEEILKGLYE